MLQAFRTRYPEFDNVPDERIAVFIEDAEAQLNSKVWGRLYQQGLLALVAHLLKINGSNGGGSSPFPVSNKTAGSLSIGYAVPATTNLDEALLLTTTYGQSYLRLRKLVSRHVMVVSWGRQ